MIVASKSDGIEIHGKGARDNLIQYNWIGNDGEQAIPNEGHGILISGSPKNRIEHSTISGNAKSGIVILGEDSSVNEMSANYIGAIKVGSDLVAMGNGEDGILIFGGNFNAIGSRTGGAPGNIISGNHRDGIGIVGDGGSAIGNWIGGNGIGTEEQRDTAIPNDRNGISLFAGADWTEIGGSDTTRPGTCEDPCNVISGNAGNGIEVLSGAHANQVAGNVDWRKRQSGLSRYTQASLRICCLRPGERRQ